MNPGDVRQFEDAFDMHIIGPMEECRCGKIYWDSLNSGYDWEDGEEDRLRENPNATAVPHGIQRIELEGAIYCMDCTCWHKRAELVIAFLRSHQQQIGEWHRLEKQRLLAEAADVPEVR